jgi:hypothetical protein
LPNKLDKLISGRQTGQGTTLNHCEQVGMTTGINPLDLPSSDPISMKEKPLHWVTYLVSRVEISPQIQTRRVKKINRITHLKFWTACL